MNLGVGVRNFGGKLELLGGGAGAGGYHNYQRGYVWEGGTAAEEVPGPRRNFICICATYLLPPSPPINNRCHGWEKSYYFDSGSLVGVGGGGDRHLGGRPLPCPGSVHLCRRVPL